MKRPTLSETRGARGRYSRRRGPRCRTRVPRGRMLAMWGHSVIVLGRARAIHRSPILAAELRQAVRRNGRRHLIDNADFVRATGKLSTGPIEAARPAIRRGSVDTGVARRVRCRARRCRADWRGNRTRDAAVRCCFPAGATSGRSPTIRRRSQASAARWVLDCTGPRR
jgi:hypothetical protein